MSATDTRAPARKDRRTHDRPPPGRERRRAELSRVHPARAPHREDRDTVVEFRVVYKLCGPGGIGLERATFAIRRQEMVFLVGPTGSGKSTIIDRKRTRLNSSHL